MAEIRVITKKTFKRKIGLLLKTAVATTTILGALAIPATINQLRLPKYREELSDILVEENMDSIAGSYKTVHAQKALEKFEEIASRRFIIPETVEKERSDLYAKIRKESGDELESALKNNWYKYASDKLESIRGQPCFTKEDISAFEQKLASIHPDAFVERAEKEANLETRFELYDRALINYRQIGIKNPKLRGKLFDTSLEIFITENDLPCLKSLDNLDRAVRFLQTDNGEKPQLSPEKQKLFFEFSDKFLEDKLLKNSKDSISFDKDITRYFNSISIIYDSFGIGGKEERIKDYADKSVDSVRRIIEAENNYNSNGQGLLDKALDLNKKYFLGREGELVRLYLTFEERSKEDGFKTNLLDKLLDYSKSLPKETRKPIQEEMASRYVSLAEKTKDPLAREKLLYSGLSLYASNGVDITDPRIKRVVELIGNSNTQTENKK